MAKTDFFCQKGVIAQWPPWIRNTPLVTRSCQRGSVGPIVFVFVRRVCNCWSSLEDEHIIIIIIIIMSLMLISSSDEDIRGVPSMQSSYSAEKKWYGICMEERRVHCKCVGRNLRRRAIDNYGGRDFWYKKVLMLHVGETRESWSQLPECTDWTGSRAPYRGDICKQGGRSCGSPGLRRPTSAAVDAWPSSQLKHQPGASWRTACNLSVKYLGQESGKPAALVHVPSECQYPIYKARTLHTAYIGTRVATNI